jgi:hypothetical protein
MHFQGQRGLTNDQRFDASYTVGDACWEWTGACDKDGYGIFWDAEKPGRVRANRFALERITGPLGELQACHQCDNPKCVRPAHLFAGTGSDNMHDKASKGRTLGFASLKGEQHTQAKLSEAEVAQIKRRLLSGEKQKTLAAEFGVGSPLISRINSGKIWKDVAAQAK